MAARALPDLVARIRVDSSGVDTAMTNLVGSFGRANLALAGVAAGIGILILGTKSMIDISLKHQQAENDLTQAVEAHNAAIGKSVAVHVDVSRQIAAHNVALRHLAEVEAGMPTKHRATTLELMHLADAHQRVKETANALAAAEAVQTERTDASSINLAKYQSTVDEFIKTNRRYISDQSEVVEGYAKLTRAGLSQTEVQLDMNRAVDLAALKHISLSDAVDLLQKAEVGRLRGLIDLGVSTGKYTDAQGNLINGTKDVGRAMDELDKKTAHGRETLIPLIQAENELNNTWQSFAIKYGPAFIAEMTAVVNWVNANMPTWLHWASVLDHIAGQLAAIPGLIAATGEFGKGLVAGAGGGSGHAVPPGPWSMSVVWDSKTGRYEQSGPLPEHDYVDVFTGVVMNALSGNPANARGLQYGGSMIPGGIYRIGEVAAETVVMHPSGGASVIPDGGRGGGGDTFHFHQVQTDPWQTANEIAWAKKTRRI